jgi:hypothetical protein
MDLLLASLDEETTDNAGFVYGRYGLRRTGQVVLTDTDTAITYSIDRRRHGRSWPNSTTYSSRERHVFGEGGVPLSHSCMLPPPLYSMYCRQVIRFKWGELTWCTVADTRRHVV